jgi:hypothetical protein
MDNFENLKKSYINTEILAEKARNRGIDEDLISLGVELINLTKLEFENEGHVELYEGWLTAAFVFCCYCPKNITHNSANENQTNIVFKHELADKVLYEKLSGLLQMIKSRSNWEEMFDNVVEVYNIFLNVWEDENLRKKLNTFIQLDLIKSIYED